MQVGKGRLAFERPQIERHGIDHSLRIGAHSGLEDGRMLKAGIDAHFRCMLVLKGQAIGPIGNLDRIAGVLILRDHALAAARIARNGIERAGKSVGRMPASTSGRTMAIKPCG